MPGKKKPKNICIDPNSDYFKPRGIPLSELEEVVLDLEELETLKLKLEGNNQTESAEKMNIHQSTYHRIYSKAILKISDALVNGKAIRIKKGD